MQAWKSVSLIALASLGGCANIPTSGPSGQTLEKSIVRDQPPASLPIKLVNIETAGDLPDSAPADKLSLPDLAPPPTDMVGPGDILNITIYEAGITLFSGGGSAMALAGAAPDSGAQAHVLPAMRVDDDGNITLPYAGKLHVTGRTVSEIGTMVRSALRSMSQNPQVTVNLAEDITNSVILGGEVAKPGRLVLNTNREHLSDVIALAGGYRGPANDLLVRINRGSHSAQVRMSELLEKPSYDIRAYPGDRIMLVSDPMTYSVLGSSGKVSRVPFTQSQESLVEAIATAGGVNPNSGDPAALFVFRYVPDADGKPVPVVYHFNMMQGSSFFLAQRFAMRDKDVLYFGAARANQPAKLFQLISQLFTPLMTVTAAVNAVN